MAPEMKIDYIINICSRRTEKCIACEQQTHFRCDDRKCVCCSQAKKCIASHQNVAALAKTTLSSHQGVCKIHLYEEHCEVLISKSDGGQKAFAYESDV